MITNSDKNDLKSAFISVLENIISQFSLIFNTSETQFLRVSKELQQFYKDSKEVAAKGINVIDLLTSPEYKSGIKNLSTDFNLILEHISATKKNIENTESFLNKITGHLNSASDEVSGFSKIFRHLEMQSISIKIESARLGGNDKGFRILADDIHMLATLISNQSTGFHKKAKNLLSTANEVKSQVDDLKKYEDKHSKNILENITKSLTSLNEKYQLSVLNSEGIHAKIADIQQKTGSLVTEVQFHDITRQQMENICNVVKNLIQKINDDTSEDIDKELYSYIYKVTVLQSAQLKNSKKELFEAVNNIILNLEEIRGVISDINSDILMLLDNSGNNYHSFIDNINIELNNILTSLTKSEEARNKFSGSIENVASTIGMLSEFIDEINKISSEIELLSLNSSIKAAHTGAEGAGLGVLAEAIQKLSSDSNKQTKSVIEILMQTNGLSDNLNSLTSKESDAAVLKSSTEEINTNFKLLKNIMNNVVAGFTKTGQSVSKLKEEMEKSVLSFKEYLMLQKQVEQIISALADISSKCEKHLDKNVLEELKLDGLTKNYTMQIQRDIHNSIYSKNNKKQVNTNNPVDINTKDSSEFGDNVELF